MAQSGMSPILCARKTTVFFLSCKMSHHWKMSKQWRPAKQGRCRVGCRLTHRPHVLSRPPGQRLIRSLRPDQHQGGPHRPARLPLPPTAPPPRLPGRLGPPLPATRRHRPRAPARRRPGQQQHRAPQCPPMAVAMLLGTAPSPRHGHPRDKHRDPSPRVGLWSRRQTAEVPPHGGGQRRHASHRSKLRRPIKV